MEAGLRPLVAVVGAGAMGCLFAHRLSAVADVTLLTSERARALALARDGLLVHRDGRPAQRTFVATASAPEELAREPRLVVLCVKTSQLRARARSVAAWREATFLSIQNGVAHLDWLAQELGSRRLVFGATYQAATKRGEGEIAAAGDGATELWSPFAEADVEQVAALLRRAGMPAVASADGLRTLWLKFVVTCAVNAPCALTRRRLAAMGGAAAAPLVEQAIREALSVAPAQVSGSVTVAEGVAEARHAIERIGGNSPSILQDVRAHRPTEARWINGHVVELAQRAGVEVPVNRVLFQLLTLAEQSYADDVERAGAAAAPNGCPDAPTRRHEEERR